MAAEFLGLRGPLGGANFLSVGERLAANAAMNKPGMQVLDTIKAGQYIKNARTVDAFNQTRVDAGQMENAENQRAIAVRNEAEAAIPGLYGLGKPAEQTPSPTVQPQTTVVAGPQEPAVPTQVAPQAVQPSAPQAAQAAVPAAAPVVGPQEPAVPTTSPAQTVEVTGQRMTPEQKAAYDAANPPVVQQPAPAVGQASAAPVSNSVLQNVQRTVTGIQGRQDLYTKQKTEIERKIMSGEVSPAAGQMLLTKFGDLYKFDQENDSKLANTLAQTRERLSSGDLTEEQRKKAVMETQAAVRDHDRNKVFMALQLPPEAARAELAASGMDPSKYIGEDGKPTAVGVRDAENSPAGKEMLKQQREADRQAREDRKVDILEKKAEAEIAEKKAEAARAERNTGYTSDGSVSVVKEDKQGNRFVPKDVVQNLQSIDSNAKLAASLLKTTDELVKDNYAVMRAAPESGLSNKISDLGDYTGIRGESTKAREKVAGAADQAISFLATVDPRAKGAPSNSDIEGIKKIFSNPDSSAEQKIAAINTVRGWAQNMLREQETSFSSLDQESRDRLKPFGISGDTKPSTAPNASAAPSGPPKKGDIRKGYVFMGGDPRDQKNWKKA